METALAWCSGIDNPPTFPHESHTPLFLALQHLLNVKIVVHICAELATNTCCIRNSCRQYGLIQSIESGHTTGHFLTNTLLWVVTDNTNSSISSEACCSEMYLSLLWTSSRTGAFAAFDSCWSTSAVNPSSPAEKLFGYFQKKYIWCESIRSDSGNNIPLNAL